MPSVTPFTRQLGAQSGVQLNPIIDASGDRFAANNTDQTVATVGRFERGRIDRSFEVDRSNLYRKLGQPASTQASRLNETFIHVYEAMANGAYKTVVSRLVPAAAANLLMVCAAQPAATVEDTWVTAASPAGGYLLSVKHLECFNEGVRVSIHAVAAEESGTPVASKYVQLRLIDKTSGETLFEFEGSLDPLSKDEFGQSNYLPNVVSKLTDDVEVVVANNASVPIETAFYGLDDNDEDKWVSADLVYFTEGGTAYASTDYDAALSRLRYGEFNFGYLMGGGTRAPALLTKMIAMGVELNKQVAWDVPGDLNPEAAITFYESLNVDTMYSQAYWAPMKLDDPVNGGKDFLGRSCVNVGLRCARNARTDANGIAPKHYPVAGKEWPLTNSGIVQTYTPTEQELDRLAKAKINPVLFTRYNSGSRYVFFDFLTGAKTAGDKKLINIADMAASNDDWVTAYAQECLALPMEVAINQVQNFLQGLFTAEQTAGWIKPSAEMDGLAFQFSVTANNLRPKDRMDVAYKLYYEGAVRAIYVQQTISK